MSSAEISRSLQPDTISEHQRILFAHIDKGFAACEMLYDAAGRPCDYRFIEVNEAFERQSGLRSADILGKTVLELLPDVERTWIERFGKICTTGIADRFESFNHNTARHYEIFAYSPEPSAFFQLIRDITTRKQAEQALIENETRLRLALQAGRMATWTSNYLTGEYTWDEETVRLLGYKPGTGASYAAWARRVHPEDLTHVESIYGESLRRGGNFSAEYRVFSQRDEIRWVEARGHVLADEYGKITRSYGVMIDITDRKHAEDRLERSADLLRLALSSSQAGFFDLDIARQSLRWSPEFASLHGFNPGAFDGSHEHWRKCVHPEDLAMAEAHLEQALRTGELKGEWRIVRRDDGEIRWIRARGKVFFDPRNNPLRLVGINTDITESKRIEEALRLTNERFEVALRESPVVVFNQDLDLRYTWIYNPALGYNPAEVIGKRDIDLFENGEDAAVTEGIKRNVIRSGIGRRQDVTVHDHGIARCYDLVVDPQRDAGGNIVGVTCAAIDRTERKHAEQDLLAERRLTETVLQQIPCAVALVRGHDLTFQLVNAGYEALAPGRQMLGRTVQQVWPEIPGYEDSCRRVLKTGEPFEIQDEPVPSSQPAGVLGAQTYFSWSMNRIQLPGEEGWGLLIKGWETTARKRAEEVLLRSEKLASAGRMAASIAHEINNPLNAIANLLYLAKDGSGSPESSREYIELAEAELSRIAHTTRQSLAFYREPGAALPTRLNALLDSTIDLMRSRISSTNAHITTSWDGEVELTAAPGELRQIFSNLLANSLDAIEPGGSIRVKVSTTRNPNSGGRGGPGQLYARVTIADNGRGIPAHARAQIFEPFFTTKGAIGTGLGLWVSQQLVDKHSGSIRLRSSANPPRRGTTFCVTLPIHPSAR